MIPTRRPPQPPARTLAPILLVFAVFAFVASAHAAKYKILHAFGRGSDGRGAFSSVTRDTSGNLYGTTTGGGLHGQGTAFEIFPSSHGRWNETLLHSFSLGDGILLYAGLVLDGMGNLYGTAASGGADGIGTVFELSPQLDDPGSWTFSVLYEIGSNVGLILDQAGNLYGPIGPGRYSGAGAVTELSPPGDGGWTETYLYSFCPKHPSCLDGDGPNSPFTWDAKGNLYGTTIGGGNDNAGVVFELERTTAGWREHVLHNFAYSLAGWDSYGGVTVDAGGNVYGTTSSGGHGCPNGCGTVFKLSRQTNGQWKRTILYDFPEFKDGAGPLAGVVFDQAGNLYGTASAGGDRACNCGVVFKMTPGTNGNWTYTVLHRFTGYDGWSPQANLILDDKGNIYGTTIEGGPANYGVVFEITP